MKNRLKITIEVDTEDPSAKEWETMEDWDIYDEALRNTSLRSVNVNIVNDEVEYSLFHIYAKLSTIAHYLNEGWCMSDDGHVG